MTHGSRQSPKHEPPFHLFLGHLLKVFRHCHDARCVLSKERRRNLFTQINDLQTYWAYLPLLQEKDGFEVALSQKPLRFIPVAVCHTPKKSNRAVQKNVDTRITWFQTLP